MNNVLFLELKFLNFTIEKSKFWWKFLKKITDNFKQARKQKRIVGCFLEILAKEASI